LGVQFRELNIAILKHLLKVDHCLSVGALLFLKLSSPFPRFLAGATIAEQRATPLGSFGF